MVFAVRYELSLLQTHEKMQEDINNYATGNIQPKE